MLDKETFYPVRDWIPNISAHDQRFYRVLYTGEVRAPKKGEWFLSGSIIEAYRAYNDISLPHHIGKLVKVRRVEYWEIDNAGS